MRSIKHECLNRVIPFGERHLRRMIAEFVAHHHRERNHQGLENELIEGAPAMEHEGRIRRMSSEPSGAAPAQTRVPSVDRGPSIVFSLLAAALTGTLVLVLQTMSGAFAGELTAHSDESAHFTTGLMVFDYIRTALGTDPIKFAGSYYLHYPKVAIGHWPPGFYVVQAAWYAVVGSGPRQAFLLQAVLTSLISAILFHRTRRSVNAFSAFLALAVFLSLPLVQASGTQIMAEMLLSLLCLLAVLVYGDFLASLSWKHALLFAACSSLAILTKASAAALGLLPAAALLTVGRPAALKSRRLWLAGLMVIVVAAPFYVAAQSLGLSYPREAMQIAGVTTEATKSWSLFRTVSTIASWPVLAIASIGAFTALRDRVGDRAVRSFDAGVSLAWLLAMTVFIIGFPLTSESRYFVPALAPLAILFAQGIAALGTTLAAFSQRSRGSRAVPAIVAIFIIGHAARHLPSRLQGYEAAAAFIPTAPDNVVLVSSTPLGEGAMIAARLMRDRGRGAFVLRATKALADSDWQGAHLRLRFGSTDEVRAYLNQVPVRYVVLDDTGYSDAHITPHHELLHAAVQEKPSDFVLIKTFPLYRDNWRFDNAVRVYENRSVELRSDGAVQFEVRIPSGTLSTKSGR